MARKLLPVCILHRGVRKMGRRSLDKRGKRMKPYALSFIFPVCDWDFSGQTFPDLDASQYTSNVIPVERRLLGVWWCDGDLSPGMTNRAAQSPVSLCSKRRTLLNSEIGL